MGIFAKNIKGYKVSFSDKRKTEGHRDFSEYDNDNVLFKIHLNLTKDEGNQIREHRVSNKGHQEIKT